MLGTTSLASPEPRGATLSLDVPYKITLGPMPDHEILRRIRCRAWLPYAVREILVLHRVE